MDSGASEGKRTLLRNTPALVGIELIFVARLHHGGVAAGARQGDLHRLVEEIEALDVGDGGGGRLGGIEDDKRLALGLEVRFGDDIYHVAIFGKDGM